MMNREFEPAGRRPQPSQPGSVSEMRDLQEWLWHWIEWPTSAMVSYNGAEFNTGSVRYNTGEYMAVDGYMKPAKGVICGKNTILRYHSQ